MLIFKSITSSQKPSCFILLIENHTCDRGCVSRLCKDTTHYININLQMNKELEKALLQIKHKKILFNKHKEDVLNEQYISFIR